MLGEVDCSVGWGEVDCSVGVAETGVAKVRRLNKPRKSNPNIGVRIILRIKEIDFFMNTLSYLSYYITHKRNSQ